MGGAGTIILLIVVVLAAGGGVAYFLSTQSTPTRPATGNWDFAVSGCWLLCSHYRVGYSFPAVFNTSTVQSYLANFTVNGLQGTTNAVQLHLLNVTMTDDQGYVVYFQSFITDRVLADGQSWGAATGNFTFPDTFRNLQPGQSTTINVRLSVEFDEIAQLTSWHYRHTEKSPSILMTATRPNPTPKEEFQFNIGPVVVGVVLVGLAIYAGSALLGIVGSVPRHGDYGWRDPGTGRFMSSWGAFLAIFTIIGGLSVWLLDTVGAPGIFGSVTDLFVGKITGNLGIAAPLGVILFAIGTLLHFGGRARH